MANSEKLTFSVRKDIALSTARVAFASVAIFAATECAPKIIGQSLNDNFPTTRFDQTLNDQKRYNLSDYETNELLISKHKSQREGLINVYDDLLHTNLTEKQKDTIREERISIVLDGAEILKRLPFNKTLEVDRDKKIVTLGEKEFNLKSTNSLFMIDSIISTALSANETGNTRVSQMKAKRDLQDLLWLSEQDFQIGFTEFSSVLPTEEKLISTARMCKKLAELGYPVPKIEFELELKDASGRYIKDLDLFKIGGISVHIREERAVIGNEGQGKTVVHELAHFQADVNGKMNQDKFDTTVKKAQKTANLQEEDVKKSHVTGYATTSNKEDYAETITLYFWDGEWFRRKLNELRDNESPEYSILKAKYDFAKAFFNGEEYTSDGIVFYPKPGEVFEVIHDPTHKKSIDLWASPYSIGDETNWSGFIRGSSEKVIILDGPKQIISPTGEKVMAVKVKGGAFYDTYEFSENTYDFNEGWIIADYLLGDKLTPIGSAVTNDNK